LMAAKKKRPGGFRRAVTIFLGREFRHARRRE